MKASKPDKPEALFERALLRARVDKQFRQRLLSTPREAFREEGVAFPENESITVHELDAQHKHFFLLPMVSALKPTKELRANPPAGAPATPPSAGWHRVLPMKRLFHSGFISGFTSKKA